MTGLGGDGSIFLCSTKFILYFTNTSAAQNNAKAPLPKTGFRMAATTHWSPQFFNLTLNKFERGAISPHPLLPPPNPPCQQPTAVFALQVFFLNANSEDGTFCTSSEFDVCIKVLSPNIMSWLGLKLLLVIWIKLDIPSARIPPSPKSILFKTTPGRTCKCPPHSLLSLFPALKNNS